MNGNTRTKRSLKNMQTALLFYIINLVLAFISRKVFIDHLGIEVLGLNTTATNILGFLNIAELGIGSAISYTLYHPLFEKDRQMVNEIVSVQGWLYRKVAYVMILGACILIFFFPLIFKKMELPMWYAYASFIVLLVSSLFGYFINYRQIVLIADQKEYKVTYCVQGGKTLKYILQIIAIMWLMHGYVYWLVIELLVSFIIACALNVIIEKEYFWLNTYPSKGKLLRKKYPEIITKTKQLFFHRIAAFVLSQTSPLIIYAYASLTLVAIYGNYMLIIGGITLFVNSCFNGMSAGIGNLVAEGNKAKIKSFYWEMVAVRYWFASILCFSLFMLTNSFVSLWVGEKYILPQSTFILLLIYVFIVCTRVHDLFIAAFGMYQDIWAPALEAGINIGCSILLGYYWGLNGIIGGVILSLLLIIFCWKPYFLFRYGFRDSIKGYIFVCLKYLLLIFLASFITYQIINVFMYIEVDNIMQWMMKACLCVGVYFIVSVVLFRTFDSTFFKFINRIVTLIYKR